MKEMMKNMKNTGAVALAGLLAALAYAGAGHAQQALVDDLVYYEIGGGQAIGGPASYRRQTRIGGAASLSLGYSCGQFDLGQNLRHMFGNLTNSLDRAVDSLTFAATGVVASLPLYLLRQANPNLANMMENMMLRYEEEYRLGVKSCRDAERQILAGENPYYDWLSIGQRDTWRKSAGSGAPVTDAEEAAWERHGCVTWVNGDEYFCDDSDTREISVYGDVAREGYGLLEEPDGSAPDGAAPSRLRAYWPTPDDAVDEILQVTGETVITNARTTPPSGTPPRGLGAGMHEEAVGIAGTLREAVDSPTEDPALADELERIGVPGLAVTPWLIASLRALAPDLQASAIERIATEIALLRALEKIHLARRVLLAGARVPEVQASPARDLIREEALPLLEMEARLLQDEYDLRTRAASSTAAKIIQAGLQGRRPTWQGDGGVSPAPLTGGGVIR